MIITESIKNEIVVHIKQAKDKRKQVQIEADLYGLSKGQVKDIMKEKGISLRILNGDNLKKKHIEDEITEQKIITPVEQIPAAEREDETNQAWADLAIPPYSEVDGEPLPPISNEERVCEGRKLDFLGDVQDIPRKPYTKPEILDGPPPKSSASEENAADSPRMIKDISCETAIIIGPHIIEDEQIMIAVNKKIKELAVERQAHVKRIEAIDNTLRKYAYFCTDCSNFIESEGIEV